MTALNFQNPASVQPAQSLRWFLAELDQPGSWRRNPGRWLLMFVGFATAYTALCGLGYALSLGESAIVIIWPAAGLLIATVASTPRRLWPLWFVATFVGRLAAEMLFLESRGWQLAAGFSMASCIEALVFGIFMQRPLQQSYRSKRPLFLIIALLTLACASTVVGGLVAATIIEQLQQQFEAPFWVFWRIWVAGDFLGIIVVAPVLTRLFLPQISLIDPQRRLPEAVFLALSMALAAGLPVAVSPDAGDFTGAVSMTMAIVMTLPMFWAGARFSYPVAMLAQSVFVVAGIVQASYGVGLFNLNQGQLLPELSRLQLYLSVSIVVVLLAVFVLVERRLAISDMRLHRSLGNVLVTLTDKLVNADSASFDKSVQLVLQEIANFARADRTILFEIDPVTQTVNRLHRWNKPGVGEHSEKLIDADPRQFPWVMRQFRERGYFVLENFDDELPEGAEELREIQQTSPSSTAVVYIGLFNEGQLSGIIGCGYTEKSRRWNNESLSLMYLVGQLFANVLIRKNAEQALHEYRDKLRHLATEVAMSEERARRQTAIDLHDGIGQNLAVARMKIGQLLVASSDNKAELTQLRGLIDEALRGTRFIISDLSPSILYELGLVPALQSLAERFEIANDLHCTLTETGESWDPDNDMRITLYRAVQEFLNNIARHAQASEIGITVAWQNDCVDIMVTDDGIGFDVQEATTFRDGKSGFGLFSVRESINLVGGSLQLDSALGLGSKVLLTVPRGVGGET